MKFGGLINRVLFNQKLKLSSEDSKRLAEYQLRWNMYKGFHWEDMKELGKAEVTINKCRSFVDKAVAKEFKGGFKIKMLPEIESLVLKPLNYVWDDMNSREILSEQLGQIRSILGSAWVKVEYISKTHAMFNDPYDEYPKGKIAIKVYSPEFIFVTRNQNNPDIIEELTFMYEIQDDAGQDTVYKEVWTKDQVEVWIGETRKNVTQLAVKVIPFFEVPNLIVGNTVDYKSDLEDLIPLNIEYNLKASDISEIIDYHASPVTVVYGAMLDDMDKGADKLWSGLPRDARVENLNMDTDLTASNKFLELLKSEMHEVGSIPEIAFGSGMHISNTSGVALETAFAPLTELVDRKRNSTKKVLPEVNKYIIKLMLDAGMITKPDEVSSADFYANEIIFENFLPKDQLTELNCISTEMKLGLENRNGAMKRLGKADIEETLKKIDEDRAKNPDIYNLLDKGESTLKRDLGDNKEGKELQVNDGHSNSPVPKKD